MASLTLFNQCLIEKSPSQHFSKSRCCTDGETEAQAGEWTGVAEPQVLTLGPGACPAPPPPGWSQGIHQEQVGSWCPVLRVTWPRLRPAPALAGTAVDVTGGLAPVHPGTFLAQPLLFFFFFLVTLSPTPPTLTPLFLKNALSLPRGSLWAVAPGGKCGLDFLEHAELESQCWEEGSCWQQSNSRPQT